MGTLHRVVYVSRAAAAMDDAQLQKLASHSAERNATVDITGLLVFGGGWFIQAIEGPQQSVSRVLKRIISDRRHRDIEILLDTEVDERLFQHWSMGVFNLDLVEQNVRLRLLDVLSRARRDGGTQTRSREATMTLLREFRSLMVTISRKAG